jgi:hypothetical protein
LNLSGRYLPFVYFLSSITSIRAEEPKDAADAELALSNKQPPTDRNGFPIKGRLRACNGYVPQRRDDWNVRCNIIRFERTSTIVSRIGRDFKTEIGS